MMVAKTVRECMAARCPRLERAVIGGLLWALLAAGCSEARVYIGDGGRYHVELQAGAEPTFMGMGGGAIYIVEQRVELPVRAPTAMALADLTQAATRYPMLPFPRLPWVERGALPIEVDFVLENLEDSEREIAVIVNGWNEFHEYQPGVQVIDQAPTPDYSQWEWLYKLKPKQRVTRTVREEEFDEIAVDLATVVNGAPNSNQVVYFENQSSADVRSQPFIPPVIPGLMGFRLGLRTTTASGATLDASVRVRDAGDRLADSDQMKFQVQPMIFTPVAPQN
jgi:hypothetical protein